MVAAMLMLLLGAFYKSSQSFTSSLRVNERTSAVSDRLDFAMHVVEQAIRPADAASFKSVATDADVQRSTLLGKLLPILGDWQKVALDVPRTTLQFLTATKTESTASVPTTTTTTRGLRFVRDPGELANGRDDNANGLIDEGRLVYDTGTEVVTVLPGVESFSMTVDGRVVRVMIRIGQKDGGRVYRATLNRSIYVRNSSG